MAEEVETECVNEDVSRLIIETLEGGEKSISEVARRLNAKGLKLHRLEVAGYLKALAQMGVLRVKEIKPSLVFSLNEG